MVLTRNPSRHRRNPSARPNPGGGSLLPLLLIGGAIWLYLRNPNILSGLGLGVPPGSPVGSYVGTVGSVPRVGYVQVGTSANGAPVFAPLTSGTLAQVGTGLLTTTIQQLPTWIESWFTPSPASASTDLIPATIYDVTPSPDTLGP